MKIINGIGLVLALGALLASGCRTTTEERPVTLLDEGWKFTRCDAAEHAEPAFNDKEWETVSVPHDWAIAGPFDMDIDSQEVKVIEDGDKVSRLRTGRTGALPFIGTGWYRYHLGKIAVADQETYRLEFDGAMSNAKIYVNGKFVGERPYGYSSFAFDITGFLSAEKDNVIAVRLENKEKSSRWYPGAGLYRNVRLVRLNDARVAQWGTCITTPEIIRNKAIVNISTTVENPGNHQELELRTIILDQKGRKTAQVSSALPGNAVQTVEQSIKLNRIRKWDVDDPHLYTAVSMIYADGELKDTYKTSFGIRSIEFTPDEGFLLNGEIVKIKGVCMHHDLGPLGTAVNERAIERQLQLLQEMGCNAIRTSHNPPAPELLDLCDRMGFLVMDESFDEWSIGKNENGYSNFFSEWAEKDLTDMIHRDRNHPSVILWSIGNEIREQGKKNGVKVAEFLNGICKREDPTRPTTAGFNNHEQALRNGFGDVVDVFGFNYKPFAYDKFHQQKPDYCLLGSETASTVSSRGKYHFPAKETKTALHEDFQSSSYDLEYPAWASTPDTEFTAQDKCDFVAGEFVWTGFDYLGEPTPYNETYSSRSSYFGIIDLAGLKKDRFWLYQSRWSDQTVLHLLPHWNWKEGDIIPVHCYTNCDEVELFLNGKSLGRKAKNAEDKMNRHRIVWDGVPFEAGEIKAVGYNGKGKAVEETSIRTAGAPHHLILTADRTIIGADGKDLSFVEIAVADKDGNLCPEAENRLLFRAADSQGADCLKALCNGDPTSLESFTGKTMKAFSGKCVAVIGKTRNTGKIVLSVASEGLEPATIDIQAE